MSDTQLFAREARSLCVAFELILCVRTLTDFSFNTLAPHITETLIFTGWSPQSRLLTLALHRGRAVNRQHGSFVEPGRNVRPST
jgi:hypothetical protein